MHAKGRFKGGKVLDTALLTVVSRMWSEKKTQRVGMRSKKESIMIKIGVNRLKKIRRGVEMQIMVKRD